MRSINEDTDTIKAHPDPAVLDDEVEEAALVPVTLAVAVRGQSSDDSDLTPSNVCDLHAKCSAGGVKEGEKEASENSDATEADVEATSSMTATTATETDDDATATREQAEHLTERIATTPQAVNEPNDAEATEAPPFITDTVVHMPPLLNIGNITSVHVAIADDAEKPKTTRRRNRVDHSQWKEVEASLTTLVIRPSSPDLRQSKHDASRVPQGNDHEKNPAPANSRLI